MNKTFRDVLKDLICFAMIGVVLLALRVFAPELFR